MDILIRLQTHYPAGYPTGKLDSDHLCCKHGCVLLFSAGVSLTVFEKATAVRKLARDGSASKRSITHAILGLF